MNRSPEKAACFFMTNLLLRSWTFSIFVGIEQSIHFLLKPNILHSIPFRILVGSVALSILIACASEENKATLFQSLPPSNTNIDFTNTITSTPELNILNYIYFYNGAGVATADFNNDGLLDLYFTANQTADKLYLNKGEFVFQDVTNKAQIDNAKGWTTGVTTVDINNDGWMDLYISKLGEYLDISGRNLLFVNQGPNADGIPTFVEDAASYGLNFKGFSTQASFFDYDLDGDLDVFLLNHSTNPNLNYGRGAIRKRIDETSGDKLYENKDGVFVNVSETAGIFQSKIGYGLGLAVSDLNNDGYPDIYVGNDFFENDYLYINQGDKTFKEEISAKEPSIGHTTHYSMGNDIADLNNDGFPDIVSVDMLPEDLKTYKTSGSEFNYPIYQNYVNNGYAKQFMQNTLQLNNGNGSFSETAYLSGIAATEWSWSPLIADFNNDGNQDLYITNGILGATNDMDFINFIANDNIQKNLGKGMQEKDMAFIKKIPKKHTKNYFFSNKGNAQFENSTAHWTHSPPSYSNGAIYADLDNDGDLDIVTNNVNEAAFVLENTSQQLPAQPNYLQIEFQGDSLNRFGIGAKAILFANDKKFSKENYTTRGYLSAVAPELHFGLGSIERLDSIQIIWPDGNFETLYDVDSNEKLKANYKNAQGIYDFQAHSTTHQFFAPTALPFHFKHKENATIEFNRDPLIPFAISNEGPDVSVADVNNDGLYDLFLSGAKGQASALFLQKKDGSFQNAQEDLFALDAINEDTAHAFFDANGDAFLDLIVASGGNEFRTGKALQPRLYINNNGIFSKDTLQFKNSVGTISKIITEDFNKDGSIDLFFTSGNLPAFEGDAIFPTLYTNDGKGNFGLSINMLDWEVDHFGSMNDVVYADFNNDGIQDMITAGDWAPLKYYQGSTNGFQYNGDSGFQNSHGLWNTLESGDFDNDGDIDIIAGNWGLNSRLQASRKEPITLYRKDFDDNGSIETLVTYFYKGEETPFASKDELVKQMPAINKKFLSYSNFADAKLGDIFGENALKEAIQSKAYELASCYFENIGNGRFKKHRLPLAAQVSSVNDIHAEDFNNDGFRDLLLVGNNFEISTQLSSLDASRGVLLLNDTQGGFYSATGQKFDVSGAARRIAKVEYQGNEYLLITRNNDQPIFLKINRKN